MERYSVSRQTATTSTLLRVRHWICGKSQQRNGNSMDKWQAINTFWNSFGIPAYDVNSVDTGENAPALPYITYEAQTGALDQILTLTASLWYRSSSWADISNKADQIAETIGAGYAIMQVDGGYLWITRGQPFAQRMNDPSDDKIKRIYIITNAEFLTAY